MYLCLNTKRRNKHYREFKRNAIIFMHCFYNLFLIISVFCQKISDLLNLGKRRLNIYAFFRRYKNLMGKIISFSECYRVIRRGWPKIVIFQCAHFQPTCNCKVMIVSTVLLYFQIIVSLKPSLQIHEKFVKYATVYIRIRLSSYLLLCKE